MEINKIGVPSLLPDNDMWFLSKLIQAIKEVDDDSKLTIGKDRDGYNFILRQSSERFKDALLTTVKTVHGQLGLVPIFSYIKNSPYITFKLHLAR